MNKLSSETNSRMGITGVRHNGDNYKFIRDAQGNVVKIYFIEHLNDGLFISYSNEKLVAEYDYDAYGNCKITAYDGEGDVISSPASMHIANLNPFRWKSFYWDGAQTNLYYVNGRYYDPCMGHFVDTDTPENLLFSASTINALDRNAISFYNTIEVTPNLDNIFPANELYADPTDENAGKSWWQINWKKALQWIAFAAAVIATVIVSIINPAVGAAMASLCIKGAISGLVIGGIIGGVISAAQGGNIWSGIAEGAIYGAINGYTAAAVMFGVSAGIKAIVNAANKARLARVETFYRTMSADDYVYLQNTGKVRATSETFITKDLAYAQKYDGVTIQFKVKAGTLSKLEMIGIRNVKAGTVYPDMIIGGKGWTQSFAYFKAESGLINIGLGRGDALALFNRNILSYALI